MPVYSFSYLNVSFIAAYILAPLELSQETERFCAVSITFVKWTFISS